MAVRTYKAIADICLRCLALIVVVVACNNPAIRQFSVTSPDGGLVAEVRSDDRLEIQLRDLDGALTDWSPLGFATEMMVFREDLVITGLEQRTIDESYRMPVGKRRQRQHRANEVVATIENTAGQVMTLTVRVADDGLAYRYGLDGSGTDLLTEEFSAVTMLDGSTGYAADYSIGSLFTGTYEQPYQPFAETSESTGEDWAFPILIHEPASDRWLLFTEADLDGNNAAHRIAKKRNDPRLQVRLPGTADGQGLAPATPTLAMPWRSAWRVLIAGDLGTIVESTLVDDLSAPSQIADPTWIKPGRSSWSWITQLVTGPDQQQEYIDFASELGWEYTLVDANWDQFDNAEQTMIDLVDYAAERDVRLLIWYNSGGDHNVVGESPRDRLVTAETRQQEFAKIAGWGVAGIKVDFFESDKQDRIQQFLGILADAAEHQLLVNFHGATLPRGWQRTWPNLMSHEAVGGAEYYLFAGPTGIDHVRYALIRNVVGSMDYTPVLFAMAYDKQGILYAQQLALAVLFESGIQHYADRADGDPDAGYRAIFAHNPDIKTLLADIPAAWDETRYVSGDPDSHVVLARRSGESWYVAGINGTESAKTLQIPLEFLKPGGHNARIFTTGASPTQITTTVQTVDSNDVLEFDLAGLDGVTVRIEP